MPTILLLFFITSALAYDVPTTAANRFFDTLLEKSFNRQPSDRKVNDLQFGFLGLSFQLGNILVSGPSMLKRQGNAKMEQALFETRANGVIALGKIDYAIRNLVIDIFGYKITTAATFSLEDATCTSRIYVIQRDKENCEGTSLISGLSGKRKVSFQSQNVLYKILEYIVSTALQFRLLPVGDIFQFANLNEYLQGELHTSTNEIFC